MVLEASYDAQALWPGTVMQVLWLGPTCAQMDAAWAEHTPCPGSGSSQGRPSIRPPFLTVGLYNPAPPALVHLLQAGKQGPQAWTEGHSHKHWLLSQPESRPGPLVPPAKGAQSPSPALLSWEVQQGPSCLPSTQALWHMSVSIPPHPRKVVSV